jgi:enoyl-CoA hydratase
MARPRVGYHVGQWAMNLSRGPANQRLRFEGIRNARPKNYASIFIDRRPDSVAIDTLNRPERLNSVHDPMHAELERVPGALDRDSDIRVLVATGSGRAFCAGGDSRRIVTVAPVSTPSSSTPTTWSLNWLDYEKPVISAVNGYAMGLDSTVVLFVGIVIAARSAMYR